MDKAYIFRTIVATAVCEAELALIFVFTGFLAVQLAFGVKLTQLHMALMLQLSILLGAVIVHELIGPILARTALFKAGAIKARTDRF
jgi:hypothetical protein